MSTPNRVFEVRVAPTQQPDRLDRYLVSSACVGLGVTRSGLVKLFDAGMIRIDGHVAKKSAKVLSSRPYLDPHS